jgi:hypothetical protein
MQNETKITVSTCSKEDIKEAFKTSSICQLGNILICVKSFILKRKMKNLLSVEQYLPVDQSVVHYTKNSRLITSHCRHSLFYIEVFLDLEMYLPASWEHILSLRPSLIEMQIFWRRRYMFCSCVVIFCRTKSRNS